MVLMGSAQCTRASETQAKERVGSVCIIHLKQSALRQAAVAMLLTKSFVRSTVRRASALRMGVRLVFAVAIFAGDIVQNQSALGNGAPQLLLKGGNVTNTGVAEYKCVRSQAATLLLEHAVSAPSMGRLESASLLAAPLV